MGVSRKLRARQSVLRGLGGVRRTPKARIDHMYIHGCKMTMLVSKLLGSMLGLLGKEVTYSDPL